MENVEIFLKKLDDRAVIPSYAHNGDIGMDMTAIEVEYDAEKDIYIYHTGIALESPYGFGTFLFTRSSNRKTDAYLCNHVGVGDTAIYRGEILFCYKNRTSIEDRAFRKKMEFFLKNRTYFGENRIDDFNKSMDNEYLSVINNPMDYAPYNVGDRIGQMIVLEHPHVTITVKDELSETIRGANGFGSTGN